MLVNCPPGLLVNSSESHCSRRMSNLACRSEWESDRCEKTIKLWCSRPSQCISRGHYTRAHPWFIVTGAQSLKIADYKWSHNNRYAYRKRFCQIIPKFRGLQNAIYHHTMHAVSLILPRCLSVIIITILRLWSYQPKILFTYFHTKCFILSHNIHSYSIA